MRQVAIKDVKQGEFIRRKEDSKKTYTRGEYCRDLKRFECNDESDISRAIYLKGSTMVWVDFTY